MFDIKTHPIFASLKSEIYQPMGALLSQKQIGQRIAELRKAKGLSQENLAKNLKISRPSLAQMELGNRSIDILEFQKLSIMLDFSLDNFLSEDFSAGRELNRKEKRRNEKPKERISTPHFQPNKFKNIVLYILERCAGKPNVGEPVLHKLLYFADFNCYELYEEHLTGLKYRKLTTGPVPQKFDSLINQMIEHEQLRRIKTEYQGNTQSRYLPLHKADLTSLQASEKQVIDDVLNQMSDWSTAAITNYAIKDMPCQASKEGEEINYELVFYRETPFSVRTYEEEKNKK